MGETLSADGKEKQVLPRDVRRRVTTPGSTRTRLALSSASLPPPRREEPHRQMTSHEIRAKRLKARSEATRLDLGPGGQILSEEEGGGRRV